MAPIASEWAIPAEWPIPSEWIAVLLAGAAMMAMQAWLARRENRDLTRPPQD